MKCRSNRKSVIAALIALWLSNAAAPAEAVKYVRAAQKDELNRFPYTAATEWRQAGEVFGSNTLAGEYCWRQWERIMHLSRRLARPIGESRILECPAKSAVAIEPARNGPLVTAAA